MMPLLIPAGGRGNRAIPYTDDKPKALLNIDNKALIEYVLDVALDMGIKDAYIIVGYKGDLITDHLLGEYYDIQLHYIYQTIQKGLVHAISMAEDHINEDFIMMLSDEIYWETHHKDIIPYYQKHKLDGLCGIMKTNQLEKIKKNYSVETKGTLITRLVEKPDKIVNNLMGTGTCIFSPQIFDYINSTPTNPKRNEKELTDLVQTMINDGKHIGWYDLGGDYINVNHREDYTSLLTHLKK